MNEFLASVNVLTLKELSMYLRLPEEKIEKEVVQGRIPGRRIENDWRFLKRAIDDWLRSMIAESYCFIRLVRYLTTIL